MIQVLLPPFCEQKSSWYTGWIKKKFFFLPDSKCNKGSMQKIKTHTQNEIYISLSTVNFDLFSSKLFLKVCQYTILIKGMPKSTHWFGVCFFNLWIWHSFSLFYTSCCTKFHFRKTPIKKSYTSAKYLRVYPKLYLFVHNSDDFLGVNSKWN